MPVHSLDCVRRPTSGTVAVRIVLKVSLEDRFQHKFCGGLNHAIPDGRNAERTLASPILWDHYAPHRIRPGRDRSTARATLGKGLAVSAFHFTCPFSLFHRPRLRKPPLSSRTVAFRESGWRP